MSSMQKPSRKQAAYIINFAIANHCVINPIGYVRFAESFNACSSCPCDKSRKECPCPQAPGEIEKDGHCICQLFWKDYQAYLTSKFK